MNTETKQAIDLDYIMEEVQTSNDKAYLLNIENDLLALFPLDLISEMEYDIIVYLAKERLKQL